MLILAFPVQVLVARYLGPSQMGVYSYVLSFAALARVFVSVGLQDVLVPLYQKERKDEMFGSGWLLRQAAATLVTLTALGWTATQLALHRPDAYQLGWLIVVAVAAYQFSDHEIYSIWCKAEGRLQDFVVVDFCGTMAGLALRLGIVYTGGSMMALLWSYVGEQIAKLLLATFLYLRGGRPFLKPFACSLRVSGILLRQAWPIWVSALLTAAYARIDQLLLGSLLPDASQLGQYAVAIRLVEALTAGSVALFVVYLPILAAQKRETLPVHLQRYHDLAWLSSMLLVIPLFFLLKPLVLAMYGTRYAAAAQLSLLSLAILPVFHLSQCRMAYSYSVGLQKLELLLKVLSLAASLTLNLILIPRYGATGSVVAGLAVQWTTLLGAYLLVPAYRPAALCALRALYLPGALLRLNQWLRTGKAHA